MTNPALCHPSPADLWLAVRPLEGLEGRAQRDRPASSRADAVDETLARLFEEMAAASAPGDLRRAGDLERALGELYDRIADDLYGVSLWRTGSAADAADVVQTVFVRLAEGRVDFAAVRRPRLFLLTMARRAAIDLVRSRRPDVDLEEAPALVEPRSAADAADAAELSAELSAQLHALPPRQREALYLRFYAGLTYAEIGRMTRVPTFTAASRCRLGLQTLRRRLGGWGGSSR